MRVSCLRAKSRQHHLSQNFGPAIAGSARAVLPASLSERNECVKVTEPLKIIQGLKFKSQKLAEKVGWPMPPQPPRF